LQLQLQAICVTLSWNRARVTCLPAAAGCSGEAIWAASHQRPGAQSRSGTGRAGTGRREPQPPNPKASPIRGEGRGHTHLASRAAQQQEPSGRARDRPTTTTIIAAADEKAGGWRRARSSVRQRQRARVGRLSATFFFFRCAGRGRDIQLAGCWRFHPDGGRSLCLPGAGCFIRNPPAGHLLLHDRASRARHGQHVYLARAQLATTGRDRDADGRPPTTDRGRSLQATGDDRWWTVSPRPSVVCACHGNGNGTGRHVPTSV
jgi:hypothetical protein